LTCIKRSHPKKADKKFLRSIADVAAKCASGSPVMNKRFLVMLAACACLLAPAAEARSPYDGQWNITFVTHSGDCNPVYTYSVSIENGVISSPAVQTFRGNVTKAGIVRAAVAVQDKRASGSGKLTSAVGRGTWTGYSGGQRCAGAWTAQRTW
jgi:hypothetical protein